jgi:very-short-patch-repair endonuclease
MRHEPTDAERILWRRLRNRQVEGLKFRRQVPVAGYIVDFLCDEVRLVVEVEGGQHAGQAEYDAKRTQALEKGDWRVVRFWNVDVLDNIEGVLSVIAQAIEDQGTPCS